MLKFKFKKVKLLLKNLTKLIKVDYAQAVEDMNEKLETLKLRKQTMARQEERVMKKLEEMQTNIQAAMQGLQGE